MFALENEPMDYQLSIHYNNYREFGKNFIKDFETVIRYRNQFKEMPPQRIYAAMVGFINYYGEYKVAGFINEFKLSNVA